MFSIEIEVCMAEDKTSSVFNFKKIKIVIFI